MKQLAMAALLSTVAWASAGQAGDSTVLIKTEDAAMQAAIEHARATLDDFLKLLFKHMPADQVKRYREQYGFEC